MAEARSYLRVPRSIVGDKSVNSSDVRVFAVLLDLRSSSNAVDDGLDEIAKQTGLTKRTVGDALARLEDRGFITKERRGPYTGLITINPVVS